MDNYDNKINLLNKYYDEYRNYRLESSLIKIFRILLKWNSEYESISDDEKTKVFNKYKLFFFKIASTLKTNFKFEWKFRDQKNNKVPINSRYYELDEIDNVLEDKLFYKTNMIRIGDYINSIFTEFSKGVSFFVTNTAQYVQRPIYHRPASCGSKNRYGLSELKCDGLSDIIEIQRRTDKIIKCCIERQIYNEIYSKIHPNSEQDYNHKMMLEDLNRSRIYLQSCAPGTQLKVVLGWDIFNRVPVSLEIHIVDGKKYILEKYEKEINNQYDFSEHNLDDIENLTTDVTNLYEPIIKCLKSEWIRQPTFNTIRTDYEKKQTYQQYKTWDFIRESNDRFGP